MPTNEPIKADDKLQFERSLRSALNKLQATDPIIVIAVRGSLHVLVPALRLLHRNPVLIVGNKLTALELNYLEVHFKDIPIVAFQEQAHFTTTPFEHGAIIDIILTVATTNFYLIDPDCYILKTEVLAFIKSWDADAFCAGPYWYHNPSLGLTVPNTFCLYILLQPTLFLLREFGLSFCRTSLLPPQLEQYCLSRWPNSRPYLNPEKTYYDTAHLLILAAYARNLRFIPISASQEEIAHIGATSYRHRDLKDPGSQRTLILNAHYFHLRLIESGLPALSNPDIVTMNSHYEGSSGLLAKNLNYAGSDLFNKTSQLLNALEKRRVLGA